jgi:LacI family transcriptional regulator
MSGKNADKKNKVESLLQELRGLICEKKWGAGERLPGEREIAAQFSVARITVREALQTLELEGVVRRVHGRGTFVAENSGQGAQPLQPFTLLYPLRKGITLNVDSFYIQLVDGINLELEEAGRGRFLMLCTMQEGQRLAKRVDPARWKKDFAGGIIMPYGVAFHEDIEILRTEGIPLVFLGRPDGHEDISYVDVNNTQGLILATSHLIQHGHRSIAMINGTRNIPYFRDRLAGFRLTLEQYGLAFSEDLLVDSLPWDPQEAEDGVLALLDSGAKFSAIISCGNRATLGCMRALKARGKSVPEDVAVIAYDDYADLLTWIEPPITAVRQPIQEMGRAGMRLLRQIRDEGRRDVQKIILSPELNVRRSCGCKG